MRDCPLLTVRNQNILSKRPRQTVGLLTKQSGSGNNESGIHVNQTLRTDGVEGLTVLPNISPSCYYILTLGRSSVCDHLTVAVKSCFHLGGIINTYNMRHRKLHGLSMSESFDDPSELYRIIVSQFPSAINHSPFLFA
jgi:hypothetical protein